MKKLNSVQLFPDDVIEYLIEGRLSKNRNDATSTYELNWYIENIYCFQESDKDHEIIIALDSTPFNILDWKQLENINLKGEEDVNLHFSNGSGDFDWVEKPKLKISERKNDSFRIQILGKIGSIDLINNDGEFIEELNNFNFFIDTRMRIAGIKLYYLTENEEPLKIMSEFINLSNLKMETDEYGIIFRPIIDD